jgi:hypothetical protein
MTGYRYVSMTDTPPQPDQRNGKLASPTFGRFFTIRRRIASAPVLICCGILLVMGANLLGVMQRKTITNDEIVHIPAGYHYLVVRNFRVNPEHPPLTKMFAALPLLILKPEPSKFIGEADQGFGQLTESSTLEFWRANFDRFIRISWWSRLPMIFLTLVLGALIFIYGRQLFGARAAVLAVMLFSLEPTMLAHGRIVHTDIAAALGYLLFIFALHAYYRSPTFARAVWFGLATGFALLTKFSLIIVIPIFIGALAVTLWKAALLKVRRRELVLASAIPVAVVLALINAAYFFQHPKLAITEVNSIVGTTPAVAPQILATFQVLSKIIPTYYLFGLYTVFVHNHFGHPSFLLGDYRTFGWWYYFPVAFALKTTIPFLILSVTTLGWAIWVATRRRDKRVAFIVTAVAIYLAMSMTSNINIGIRHIAPVFPLLFLLGGGFLDRLLKMKEPPRLAAFGVALLLGWMVVDAVRTYPDYLSFTNPLTFGRQNWQLLSDSNVEWGEDIGAMARYLHSQGETQLLGSLSGGWGTAELYNIQLLDVAPPDPGSSSTRYVAIGAGFLNGSSISPDARDADGNVLSDEERHNYFAKYQALRPEKVFGQSIYLYRVRE